MQGSWRHKGSEAKRAWAKEKRERDAMSKKERGNRGHRQCGRKMRYQDEISAMLKAQQISASKGVDLFVYHCDICGGWHLTKRRQRGD